MSFKQLSRRTFLRGLGASVALPLLDGMLPVRLASTALGATTAGHPAAPVRMAFLFVPNGVVPEAWKPAAVGRDFELSETLMPLQALKSEINVISGLALDNGRAKGDGAGDHARCSASFLTTAHPVKTSGSNIRVGVSIDQYAAEMAPGGAPLSSLELGVDGSRNAGSCDSGYSCAYSSNISWKTPETPMSKEIDPKQVFDRMFGQQAEGRARRDFFRNSILDFVAADAKALQNQLGTSDRRKIDEYFTSVRELEKRIERVSNHKKIEKPDYAVPEERPDDTDDHLRLMLDLMVLAMQTDNTRIMTMMFGNAGSNRSYGDIGVKDGHHHLSHHSGDQEKVEKIKKIDRHHVTHLAYFLEKLRSTREGESNLLDNSMVLYASGLGDGNRHTHHELPVVLAGKAGGQLTTGQHVSFADETPMANLYVSMLNKFGVECDRFGDSTGPMKNFDA